LAISFAERALLILNDVPAKRGHHQNHPSLSGGFFGYKI